MRITMINLKEVGSLAHDDVSSIQLQQLCHHCRHVDVTCQRNKLTECDEHVHFTVTLKRKSSAYICSTKKYRSLCLLR